MKNISTLFLILVVIFATYTSNAQSVIELDKRNGFKDIKLASSVQQYEGLEYKEDIPDKYFKQLALYTNKKGYYESIGPIKIHGVKVLAYNDQIYKIKVVTEKNPKLYSGLKKAFGEPIFSPRGDNYYWATDLVNLTFGNNAKTRLELIYTSHLVKKRLKKDKEEEIEEISEDF